MPQKKHSRVSSDSSRLLPPSGWFWRLTRWLVLLGILFLLVLAVGSVFVRSEVIRLVRERTLSSSSLVVTSPTAITPGMAFHKTRLPQRLSRLGYIKVPGRPDRPGEYSETPRSILLSLRGGKFSEDIDQVPQLVRLSLGEDDTISEITHERSNTALSQVYLEPEALSRLGDSATRASVPKHLTEFPQILTDAVISIEDERFYSHFGIDPIGIARALVTNLTSGRLRQGGSTLTQQLAKNLFLSPARTVSRKIKEALAAVCLETAFTKDQILELYLNEVFLGQEGNVAIHGFGEAARSFFGKDVKDLSLSEAAVLAGLNKAPTSFSPRLNPSDSRERRDVVINKMLELQKISREQAERALKEPLLVRPAERSRRLAPYFVDYVRTQVGQLVDNSHWDEAPLRIVTGLDLEYQLCAEAAVSKGLKQLETKFPRLTKGDKPLQAAFIAVNPNRGDILAWVGGREYGSNQFDRVSQSRRQPGSTFKPFVYLTALDQNLNSYRVARTTTVLMDEPVDYHIPGSGVWSPKNYDDRFRGPVTVREALTHSLNVPTVELAQKVGIDAVAHTAALFGFGDNLPRVPSLALGAGEVSPAGLARAYATLANGGYLLNLQPIRAIVEADTKAILYSPEGRYSTGTLASGLPLAKGHTPPSTQPGLQTPLGQRVASEAAIYVLTTILQSVIDNGTARVVRQLGFSAPAAGKTGTSNDTRDAWFSGFTPHLLALVWVGFDDNRELKLTGGQAAAPIWTDFMKCVAPFEPQLDFVPPPGVVFRDIDRDTGLLATSACDPSRVQSESFVEGTEPVTPCTHGPRYLDEPESDSLLENGSPDPENIADQDTGFPAANYPSQPSAYVPQEYPVPRQYPNQERFHPRGRPYQPE